MIHKEVSTLITDHQVQVLWLPWPQLHQLPNQLLLQLQLQQLLRLQPEDRRLWHQAGEQLVLLGAQAILLLAKQQEGGGVGEHQGRKSLRPDGLKEPIVLISCPCLVISSSRISISMCTWRPGVFCVISCSCRKITMIMHCSKNHEHTKWINKFIHHTKIGKLYLPFIAFGNPNSYNHLANLKL